nr:MAG TPA: hypothetical protein [Caudoviricetes sp.]
MKKGDIWKFAKEGVEKIAAEQQYRKDPGRADMRDRGYEKCH